MYEYKVVPAPKRGLKGKGVKGNEGRFANALQAVMNELGKQGWDYIRTDTLPSEEREGLMGRTTVFQNMLVFRRELAPVQEDTATEVAAEIEQKEETPLLEDRSDETPQDEAETASTDEPEANDLIEDGETAEFKREPKLVSD